MVPRLFLKVCTVLVIAGLLCVPTGEARSRRVAKKAPAKTHSQAVKSEPEIPYRSYLLMDARTGGILAEENAHEAFAPASVVKMMSALVVLEEMSAGHLRWEDPVEITAYVSKIGGRQVYLKQGETMTVRELFTAMVVHSANDAATALAEYVAGTPEIFVERMNRKAAELGMKDSLFQTPHGLPPSQGQTADMSSAFDLAILARTLVQKHPEVLEFTATKTAPFRNNTFTVTNTNKLLHRYAEVDGFKTGYYREAGFSIVATGQKYGHRYIAVVLGSSRARVRDNQAAKLLFRGFEVARNASSEDNMLRKLKETIPVTTTASLQ